MNKRLKELEAKIAELKGRYKDTENLSYAINTARSRSNAALWRIDVMDVVDVNNLESVFVLDTGKADSDSDFRYFAIPKQMKNPDFYTSYFIDYKVVGDGYVILDEAYVATVVWKMKDSEDE